MTIFRQKSKFNTTEHETPKSSNRIKEWFTKWDRTIAAATAVLVFCALLILVIVNMKMYNAHYQSVEKNESDQNDVVLSDRALKSPVFKIPQTSSVCELQEKTVSCRAVAMDKLCDTINEIIQQNELPWIDRLVLTNIRYINNEIKEGWLKCINLTVDALKIERQLQNIGAKAFNGPPFSSLEVLSLNTEIVNFTRDMFDGARIKTLEIECGPVTTFEENVFGAISGSLEILQLASNCIIQTGDTDALTPILGASERLDALRIIDLRENTLNKLKRTSFQSLGKRQNLYLGRSEIEEIEPGTFSNLNLELLDLSQNKLETLPEGIFDDVAKGIDISGNQWRCDCDLVWLRDLVDNQEDKFNPASFNCSSNDGKVVPYKDYDFCPNTTATTTTSTITTTEETIRIENIEVRCMNSFLTEFPESTETAVIKVRNGSISMRFFVSATDNTWFLKLEGEIPDENLLWFKIDNKSEVCCQNLQTSKHIKLDFLNASPNETYLFCLIHSSAETISPFDCDALHIPADSEVGFLPLDAMVPLICGFCASLLFVSVLTGLIVFYCIRQNPRLIKGNKRVIIVDSEAADAVVMPRDYDEIDYKPPSMNSKSSGYLTPKNHGYATAGSSGSRVKTISESADFSVASTSQGKMIGNHRKRVRAEGVRRSCEDHFYEAPPLPPNHPLKKNTTDNTSTGYSRV